MVTKQLAQDVKDFYLSGKMHIFFVMDAVKFSIGGDVNIKDGSGDYDFTWITPKKGSVKIKVYKVENNSVKYKQGEEYYSVFTTTNRIIFARKSNIENNQELTISDLIDLADFSIDY